MDFTVSFEAPNMDSVIIMARLNQEGPKHIENGCYVFNPNVPLHDDFSEGELWLSHADNQGGTALATNCLLPGTAIARVKYYVSKDAEIIEVREVCYDAWQDSDASSWESGY